MCFHSDSSACGLWPGMQRYAAFQLSPPWPIHPQTYSTFTHSCTLLPSFISSSLLLFPTTFYPPVPYPAPPALPCPALPCPALPCFLNQANVQAVCAGLLIPTHGEAEAEQADPAGSHRQPHERHAGEHRSCGDCCPSSHQPAMGQVTPTILCQHAMLL